MEGPIRKKILARHLFPVERGRGEVVRRDDPLRGPGGKPRRATPYPVSIPPKKPFVCVVGTGKTLSLFQERGYTGDQDGHLYSDDPKKEPGGLLVELGLPFPIVWHYICFITRQELQLLPSSTKHPPGKILKSQTHDTGKIYENGKHESWVKLRSPRNHIRAYKVQIYGDGCGNFHYGIDYHGRALYYFNGAWLPYREVEGEPFPDFVKINR